MIRHLLIFCLTVALAGLLVLTWHSHYDSGLVRQVAYRGTLSAFLVGFYISGVGYLVARK